ncbi:MAG: hypothetical protein WAK31_05040 [Chthoniobacterales bacterium]
MEIDAIRIGAIDRPQTWKRFLSAALDWLKEKFQADYSTCATGTDSGAITSLETHWYWRPNTGEAEARLLAD